MCSTLCNPFSLINTCVKLFWITTLPSNAFSFLKKGNKIKDCASNAIRQNVSNWNSMSLLFFFFFLYRKYWETCHFMRCKNHLWLLTGLYWNTLNNLNSILMRFSNEFLWATFFTFIIKNDWQTNYVSRIFNQVFSNCSLAFQQTSNIRNKMWK